MLLRSYTIISLTISLTILHMNLEFEVQRSGKLVDFFLLSSSVLSTSIQRQKPPWDAWQCFCRSSSAVSREAHCRPYIQRIDY